jgi:vacuolar iron transporter family protein
MRVEQVAQGSSPRNAAIISSGSGSSAASTFASFVLCGAVPLLRFLVEAPASFQLSILMTALVFFLIGSTQSHWAAIGWWRSGGETLAIGLGATALAFLVGHGLKSLV